MALEKFRHVKFKVDSLLRIQQANEIIAEYQAEGLTLTLRQLYYQFVARAIIPNNMKEYKKLGSVISDGRLAGRIDWDAIEDRHRSLHSEPAWYGAHQFVNSVMGQYQTDLWANQDYSVEVWVEKDALLGVVAAPCEKRRVPYFACKGYTSQSAQYAAGKRFERSIANNQTPVVIYLGDHDPSGLDMTRDHVERLEMFAREGVEVRRLALNYDQVKRYSPPPNPAKMTDSRAKDYVKKYGKESWELDALEPRVVFKLVSDEIESLVDVDRWDEAVSEEDATRATLEKISNHWPKVEKQLEKLS